MTTNKGTDGFSSKEIEKIYNNPSSPGSFSGIDGLWRAIRNKGIKISKNKVKKFLETKETYTLHRPKRINYPRKRVIVKGLNDIWQIDLVDVTPINNENNGNKFILTAIDVFGKVGRAEPLKNKEKGTVRDAFAIMIKNVKPNKVQCDKGKEFYNNDFQKLLKENNIKMYSTDSDLKASVVERFNRTIKEKMWRYFTETNTKKWINILPEIIKSYNNSYHRSIKRKPNDVNKNNESDVFLTLYNYRKSDGDTSTINIKFKKGDFIRINKIKKTFEKGFTPNWTREIFKIKNIIATVPPSYKIEDLNNEELVGTLYEQEIQKVVNLNESFEIDQILKTRTVKKKKEYFVSWRGYPKSFNSWIPEENIHLK